MKQAGLFKIHKGLVRVAIIANVFGALVLFALVGIMNIDVVARSVFHAPFRGVVEVVIFSIVLIVYLQLPDVVRSGRLTRSDGFLGLLRSRRPRVGQFMSRLIDAVSALFMGMIAWTVWPEFVDAFESCHFFIAPELGPAFTGDFWIDLKAASDRCDYFGTPGILTAPWWPARLAIFFGVALGGLIFASKSFLGDAVNTPGEWRDQ